MKTPVWFPQSFFSRTLWLVLIVVLFSKALTLVYLLMNEDVLVDRQYSHGVALTLRAYWAADEENRAKIADAAIGDLTIIGLYRADDPAHFRMAIHADCKHGDVGLGCGDQVVDARQQGAAIGKPCFRLVHRQMNQAGLSRLHDRLGLPRQLHAGRPDRHQCLREKKRGDVDADRQQGLKHDRRDDDQGRDGDMAHDQPPQGADTPDVAAVGQAQATLQGRHLR